MWSKNIPDAKVTENIIKLKKGLSSVSLQSGSRRSNHEYNNVWNLPELKRLPIPFFLQTAAMFAFRRERFRLKNKVIWNFKYIALS